MTAVATKAITADEFYDWVNQPENRDGKFELERGEIVEMSRPGMLHGFVCGNIAFIFGAFARQRKKGFVCANDTGIVVERDPDTVRGTDLMFFEDPVSVADISRKFGRVPALLDVEVLSPNDSHGKVMKRVNEQLAFGTALVWVVDPDAENVTVHRSGKAAYVVEADQEITGEDVLADFRCKVSEFFKMPGE